MIAELSAEAVDLGGPGLILARVMAESSGEAVNLNGSGLILDRVMAESSREAVVFSGSGPIFGGCIDIGSALPSPSTCTGFLTLFAVSRSRVPVSTVENDVEAV